MENLDLEQKALIEFVKIGLVEINESATKGYINLDPQFDKEAFEAKMKEIQEAENE